MKKLAVGFFLIFICCFFCSNYKYNYVLAENINISMPVLMYHDTNFKRFNAKYNVNKRVLESDFEYIKKNGYTTIGIKDLIDYFDNGKKLPLKPIMITVDDGCASNYTYMYPLLKKYNYKAVFFVVGSFIDSNYNKKGELNPYSYSMNYKMLKELNDSGLVEIQSHTYNMHSFNRGRNGMRSRKKEGYDQYKRILQTDLAKLNKNLKEKCNINSNLAIAYPFGAFNKYAQKAVKELGFKFAFTCTENVNMLSKNMNFYNIFRINRDGRIPTNKFFKQLEAKKPKYC